VGYYERTNVYTNMRIIGPNGEDCGQIQRRSFSTMLFASHTHGFKIGGEEGIVLGEPVVLEPPVSTGLIPVLRDLIETFSNSTLSLGEETNDVRTLLGVLELHNRCNLVYLPDEDNAG
jgi:hypothetical protein